MINTKEQLIGAGWDEEVAEYFLHYAKTNTQLLSKVDLRIVEERGEGDLEFIRFNTKLTGVVGEYSVELRRLVANVVDRLDAYILEYCLSNYGINSYLTEGDVVTHILNNYRGIINVDTAWARTWLRLEGLKEEERDKVKEEAFMARQFLTGKSKEFCGSLFIGKDAKCIGKLEVFIGESIDGKPNLWKRRVDDLIQVGIAVKASKMYGITKIVGKYANQQN